MARNYKSMTGGLEISKQEPTEQERIENEKKEQDKAKLQEEHNKQKFTTDKMLDSAFSYLVGEMAIKDGTSQGKCLMCGVDTAFANRHICPSCLTKNKNEIFDRLKSTLTVEVMF